MYHFSDNYYLNVFLNFAGTALVTLLVWPVLDLIWCAIFHETFSYNFSSHILTPLIFTLILTVINVLTSKKKKS